MNEAERTLNPWPETYAPPHVEQLGSVWDHAGGLAATTTGEAVART